MTICVQIWVDGTLVIITAWAESSKITVEELRDRCEVLTNDIFAVYGSVFRMKVEDPSTFVGLDISFMENSICYSPRTMPPEVPRYQHFGGAEPLSEKRGFVIS